MRHGFKYSLLYFFKILLIFLFVAFVFKLCLPDSRITQHRNAVYVNILLVGIESFLPSDG